MRESEYFHGKGRKRIIHFFKVKYRKDSREKDEASRRKITRKGRKEGSKSIKIKYRTGKEGCNKKGKGHRAWSSKVCLERHVAKWER